jgi:hypothetical protein
MDDYDRMKINKIIRHSLLLDGASVTWHEYDKIFIFE